MNIRSLLDYSNTCWIGLSLTYKQPPASWERVRVDESERERIQDSNGWKSRGRKSPCLSFDMYIWYIYSWYVYFHLFAKAKISLLFTKCQLLPLEIVNIYYIIYYILNYNSIYYCFSVFFQIMLLHTMNAQSGWCFHIDSHLHVIMLFSCFAHFKPS